MLHSDTTCEKVALSTNTADDISDVLHLHAEAQSRGGKKPKSTQVSQKEGMKARRHKKADTLAHEVITRALVEVELITNTYAARFECEKENTPESRVRRYCYSACTAQWISVARM